MVLSSHYNYINAQTVTTVCAFVVSCFAIVYQRRSLKLQKKYNEMSIVPIGDIKVGDYEEDIYVSIVNNGIGPLLLQDVFVNDGKKTEKSIIILLPPAFKDTEWADFIGEVTLWALRPGDQVFLLRKKFTSNSSASTEERDRLRKFLMSLTVRITYTDIYQKKSYTSERKLEWFGRHYGIDLRKS
jgi:hypothetical protein